MVTRKQPEIVEMDASQLEALLHRAEAESLEKQDYQTIRVVFESYFQLTSLVGDKNTTIARLRKLLFGARTEKTEAVIGSENDSAANSTDASTAALTEPATDTAPVSVKTDADEEPSSSPKGHGRNGADDYPGAIQIEVPHESLQTGNPCPACEAGIIYQVAQPGVLIRFVGQAPIQATIYRLQKLRCNLCGTVFTAKPPEGAGSEKYDHSVGSMIALLKYGYGMPFNRSSRLQENIEIPLPASTQWDVVESLVPRIAPAHQELIRQAAQGEVVHNDDTRARILELMGDRAKEQVLAETADEDSVAADRTGLWTSGIVAMSDGRRMALFFTGRQHAGENLLDVLKKRLDTLAPPIQMCDALSRNIPGELRTIIANCLAHGRRRFVDIYERFQDECRYVLKALKVIYKNDKLARERKLSRDERLRFHQSESGPAMAELHTWMTRQFDEKRVEPNSALGDALTYMLKHWGKLTLFLKEPGAPLDNNICERALKKAIQHRKNALFYKTCHGARVGDLFMSLIHTCELNNANPFDYLNQLQRHAEQLAERPADWMPWNYRASLESV